MTIDRDWQEVDDYLDEAFDKVWLARTHEIENAADERKRRREVERIVYTYDDLPENEFEVGFYCGVLATLRWLQGDESKRNMDT